jgi:hypothetical protein
MAASREFTAAILKVLEEPAEPHVNRTTALSLLGTVLELAPKASEDVEYKYRHLSTNIGSREPWYDYKVTETVSYPDPNSLKLVLLALSEPQVKRDLKSIRRRDQIGRFIGDVVPGFYAAPARNG